MNRLLLATSALMAVSVSALAADLPVRAPAPAPVFVVAPFSWTGFYVGLNAGYVWGDGNRTLVPATETDVNVPLRTERLSFSDGGFTGGAQVGYNLDMGGWVIGAEADINYYGVKSSDNYTRQLASPLCCLLNVSSRAELNWGGSLRARLGFKVAPTFLVYATGGVAAASVKVRDYLQFDYLEPEVDNDAYIGSASKTRFGWTLGAGAEYAFSRNWSAKIEYLYTDLGSFNSPMPVQPPFVNDGYTNRVDVSFQTVRVGLNYRFGGASSAPVVARY